MDELCEMHDLCHPRAYYEHTYDEAMLSIKLQDMLCKIEHGFDHLRTFVITPCKGQRSFNTLHCELDGFPKESFPTNYVPSSSLSSPGGIEGAETTP